jgi:hypothetical protein
MEPETCVALNTQAAEARVIFVSERLGRDFLAKLLGVPHQKVL